MADTQELLTQRAWELDTTPVDLGYSLVPDWAKIPDNWTLGQVAGVAADQDNKLFLFHRGDQAPPLICFDVNGTVLFTWDEPKFGRPHMITIDKDNVVWLIDDGGHVIYKMSDEGDVLWTLGEPNVRMAPGTGFDQCTDIDFGQDGCMFVSDGYGVNKRVCKFDAEGTFIKDWGKPGGDPFQFALPHALNVGPDGRVYVADRENWRVQIFDQEGNYLESWNHIGRPSDIIFDPEGNLWTCDHPNGRITKVSPKGQVIGFFGLPGKSDGGMTSAHDIAYCPDDDIVLGLLDGRVQRWTKR